MRRHMIPSLLLLPPLVATFLLLQASVDAATRSDKLRLRGTKHPRRKLFQEGDDSDVNRAKGSGGSGKGKKVSKGVSSIISEQGYDDSDVDSDSTTGSTLIYFPPEMIATIETVVHMTEEISDQVTGGSKKRTDGSNGVPTTGSSTANGDADGTGSGFTTSSPNESTLQNDKKKGSSFTTSFPNESTHQNNKKKGSDNTNYAGAGADAGGLGADEETTSGNAVAGPGTSISGTDTAGTSTSTTLTTPSSSTNSLSNSETNNANESSSGSGSPLASVIEKVLSVSKGVEDKKKDKKKEGQNISTDEIILGNDQATETYDGPQGNVDNVSVDSNTDTSDVREEDKSDADYQDKTSPGMKDNDQGKDANSPSSGGHENVFAGADESDNDKGAYSNMDNDSSSNTPNGANLDQSTLGDSEPDFGIVEEIGGSTYDNEKSQESHQIGSTENDRDEDIPDEDSPDFSLEEILGSTTYVVDVDVDDNSQDNGKEQQNNQNSSSGNDSSSIEGNDAADLDGNDADNLDEYTSGEVSLSDSTSVEEETGDSTYVVNMDTGADGRDEATMQQNDESSPPSSSNGDADDNSWNSVGRDEDDIQRLEIPEGLVVSLILSEEGLRRLQLELDSRGDIESNIQNYFARHLNRFLVGAIDGLQFITFDSLSALLETTSYGDITAPTIVVSSIEGTAMYQDIERPNLRDLSESILGAFNYDDSKNDLLIELQRSDDNILSRIVDVKAEIIGDSNPNAVLLTDTELGAANADVAKMSGIAVGGVICIVALLLVGHKIIRTNRNPKDLDLLLMSDSELSNVDDVKYDLRSITDTSDAVGLECTIVTANESESAESSIVEHTSCQSMVPYDGTASPKKESPKKKSPKKESPKKESPRPFDETKADQGIFNFSQDSLRHAASISNGIAREQRAASMLAYDMNSVSGLVTMSSTESCRQIETKSSFEDNSVSLLKRGDSSSSSFDTADSPSCNTPVSSNMNVVNETTETTQAVLALLTNTNSLDYSDEQVSTPSTIDMDQVDPTEAALRLGINTSDIANQTFDSSTADMNDVDLGREGILPYTNVTKQERDNNQLVAIQKSGRKVEILGTSCSINTTDEILNETFESSTVNIQDYYLGREGIVPYSCVREQENNDLALIKKSSPDSLGAPSQSLRPASASRLDPSSNRKQKKKNVVYQPVVVEGKVQYEARSPPFGFQKK